MAENSRAQILGMTDAELELACEEQFSGIAQWVDWTSEIYSFGKCFRVLAKYPSFLPLFVRADHGVGLSSHLFPGDLESQLEVYFTWNPARAQRYKNFSDKKIIRIANPWIFYRQLYGKKKSVNTRGTLVFFTHHVPGIEWIGHDVEEYFQQLRELPEKYKPVVLCLHMHDIKAGRHKELRRHGFPIVTAGNTLSTNFVDRFYDLVKDYSYATSQLYGSQTAYCVELGIPYFLMGDVPTRVNLSSNQMPLGEISQYWDKEHEEYVNKSRKLFTNHVDEVTEAQREFVQSLLGLDSQITRKQISWIIWREFFRHWRQWCLIPRPILTALLRKFGLLEGAKKIRQKFKCNR